MDGAAGGGTSPQCVGDAGEEAAGLVVPDQREAGAVAHGAELPALTASVEWAAGRGVEDSQRRVVGELKLGVFGIPAVEELARTASVDADQRAPADRGAGEQFHTHYPLVPFGAAGRVVAEAKDGGWRCGDVDMMFDTGHGPLLIADIGASVADVGLRSRYYTTSWDSLPDRTLINADERHPYADCSNPTDKR